MKQESGKYDVRVDVSAPTSIEHAFAVFTEQYSRFWPSSFRLGEAEIEAVVIEPRVGGRWYERTADGKECGWGRVLEVDAPHHIALGWQITPEFSPEPDEQQASRVDVRFTAEGP